MLEIAGGIIIATLPAIDVAKQREYLRVIRERMLREGELVSGTIVIEITTVQVVRASQMCLARVRFHLGGVVHRRFD